MSKWDSRNLLMELLYMVLYAVGTVIVCVTRKVTAAGVEATHSIFARTPSVETRMPSFAST